MTEQAITVTTPQAMEQRIQKARFIKDLSPEQRQLLAEVAIAYGLDPVMGELILYEGKPFATVEGLIRIAHRSQCFAGLEDRPMTSEEKAAYGYTAPVCWLAKVYRSDWQVPAVGTGTADPNKPYRHNLVEPQFPQRMARVRAIRQALKLAFPNSLPFAAESAEERGVVIDRQTGEIIDSTATVVKPVETNGHQQVEATLVSAPMTPTVPAKEESALICADCEQRIPALKTKAGLYTPEQVAARTLEAFGRELCSACGEKEKARLEGVRHEAAVRGEAEQETEVEDEDEPF